MAKATTVKAEGIMVRVDEDILKQLEVFFPGLTDEGAATLVRIILKKFVEEAKRRQQESSENPQVSA